MSLDNLKWEKMSVTATLHHFSLTTAKICRIIHPRPLLRTPTVTQTHETTHMHPHPLADCFQSTPGYCSANGRTNATKHLSLRRSGR